MKTITNYIKRFLLLAAMAAISATALGAVEVTIGEKTSTYNSVTLNWSVSGGTPTAQVVK